MPAILTPSYFEFGNLAIPNAVSGNPGEGLNGDLVSIIDKYEKEVLLSALGFTQYTELQTVLADINAAADKWKNLVNGEGAWAGIKPLLGAFIFCQWIRQTEVSITTAGAGKNQVVNHSVADYNQKYVERWNEFICRYQLVDGTETSLWEYLFATDGLHADNFRRYKRINQLGL